MENSENDHVRAGACVALLDRGLGKPAQMVAIADLTAKHGADLSQLSPEELVVLERLLRKAAPSDSTSSDSPMVDVTPES